MSEIRLKKIKDIFPDYINGYAFKSINLSNKQEKGYLPLLKIANVGKNGKTDFRNCHYHDSTEYERFIAHEGDIAFSLTGSLGYVSKVTKKCLVNQRVFVLKRTERSKRLLDIIQPFIKSYFFTEYCYSKATSESNKNISPDVICNYEIPVWYSDNGVIDYDKQFDYSNKYLQAEEIRHMLLNKLAELNEVSVLFPKSNNIQWIDKDLDDLFSSINRGKSKYTKTYCKEHYGDFPVYSANNNEPLSYMGTYDYIGPCLTISINGIAGVTTIIDGKFSTNADRVVCVPKENISIDYVKHIAEPFLRDKSKGRIGDNGKNEFTKLTPDMIKKVKIPMPLNEDETYNVEMQKELAEKYDLIDKIKEEITLQVNALLNILVK